MHTKATKSWNALKRWTGEWREGAWLTPTMQKIRRYVLEYMNIKGGRLFPYTFRNCQKKIKMTGHAKRCICSSQGDFRRFPRPTYWYLALSSILCLWAMVSLRRRLHRWEDPRLTRGVQDEKWDVVFNSGGHWWPAYLRCLPCPCRLVCSKALTMLTRRAGSEQLNGSSVFSELR